MFFKHSPSTATTASSSSPLSASSSSTDDASDLSHCRYSSFYSTQCVNNHCDTVRKQFRQCDNRPPEELVTDDSGQQKWQPTDEAVMRVSSGSGLTADVSWPDPVTSIFDELRTQTKLIGDAFRQWDDQHADGGDRRADRGQSQEQRRGEGRDDVDNDVGGVMSGMLNALHGMSRDFVDALFDRPTGKPSTPRRSDSDGSGDVDDEL